ncbi:glutamine synthetase family protein [Comamonas endophytica]|uniref:Glutamine synthetase family protein n=1 Tax=Comamonas endophytica TaxID=2949090 RepID=A0ABY6GDA5_9BURK|nr:MULTISPECIES: glutamine synthetase family protein [unclassified Acidovorax]MCD2512571.1 glutamine synthetase family protein [Acidovorax sp. D4N7]UYG53067.1 glutamine synthetase family protein [Acidovorax sp. 5MLIR]
MASFVDRFGLFTAEQELRAREVAERIAADQLELVRFAFADQHGVLRGKTLVASEAISALRSGVNMTSTLLAKDTAHKTVFPVFSAGGGFDFAGMQGGADFTMVADPATFRVLPWARKTGWLLCDTYMADGTPSPLGTRQILQRAVREMQELGYDFIAGLEVEFHVFRSEEKNLALAHSGQPGLPPGVSLLSHGYQYLTEQRYDGLDDTMELLRSTLVALGLPLRSLEVEMGPSQLELTFGPTAGVMPADLMMLLRSAVKQVCARNGLHATFMCRPRIPNVCSSGWHLHQSLQARGSGSNAFMPGQEGQALSPLGMHYLGGLLEHGAASTLLASPTINGYRRFRAHSLAPDRAAWGRDNRGAMLRVLGGPGDKGSRIENRVGEPTANPYLYLASQLFSGMDGMRRQLDPGASADVPYETPAERLPRSLPDAMARLKADAYLCERLGERFVNYYCHIKQAEIDRFNLEVSEWEHREYFDLF